MHITPEMLAAAARGELPAERVLKLSLDHLLHLCPVCLADVTAWQKTARHARADSPSMFRLLPVLFRRYVAGQEKKKKGVGRDLRDLLALPQERRLEKIHHASRRFRGLPLVQRILNEARQRLPDLPREMHDLAIVAEQVLLRSPNAPGYFDALARATAYKANALRASGNVSEADERMTTARSLLLHPSVTATLVYAEIDLIEGSLRKDQGRCREAEDLLIRSSALFELAGERTEAARPLIVLGRLYYDQQEIAKAIETTETALAALHPESDPRLYLCGRSNLELFQTAS